MTEQNRTEMIIGAAGVKKLRESHVLVFGLGGVGGMLTEALARAGVGHLTIVDHDTVSASNLNRQVIALRSTIGKRKTEVMKARIADIDPEIVVTERPLFFLPETESAFDFSAYDYVVDAVDTVTAKLLIIEKAMAAKAPVISSMGTGNKLHPELFRLADISETEGCPLARVMRRELKKRGIERGVKVVFSPEKPVVPERRQAEECRSLPPGSVSFTPPVAGLLLAGEVIRDLLGTDGMKKTPV